MLCVLVLIKMLNISAFFYFYRALNLGIHYRMLLRLKFHALSFGVPLFLFMQGGAKIEGLVVENHYLCYSYTILVYLNWKLIAVPLFILLISLS